jgi:hypothetical protein
MEEARTVGDAEVLEAGIGAGFTLTSAGDDITADDPDSPAVVAPGIGVETEVRN